MVKLQKNKKQAPKKSLKFKKRGFQNQKMKKKTKNQPATQERYSKMSVDDLLNKSLDSSSTDSEIEEQDETIENELFNDDASNKSEDEDALSDTEAGSGDEILCHKESLAKLKDTDPEFYKFLQENDKKLLDFNLSDSEGEEKDDDAEDDDMKGDLHKPSGELEVASDESDFEDDTKTKDHNVITLKMLKSWQSDIRTDKSNATINKLIKACHAAIVRVSSKEDSDDKITNYKVEGSSVFNGVIQLCVLELGPALRRYLRIPPGSKQPPHKSKKFAKVKAVLRGYFSDMLKLLSAVTSTNIQTVLLKHLHYMSPMMSSFGSVVKQLLKKLIHLWGTGDDTVRVIAFLCIVRLINNQQQNHLDTVLKSMYMTYVQNAKFVSPSSLPMINFMRRSLVEMFSIDTNVSYQHVFLYIRQLAIHLRNAITVKKKENIQAVYNWQFVNSLKLWGNLLSTIDKKSHLEPLVYPYVQICLGTITLIPTAQYYPLRFHITETLIEFSKSTSVYIPILPYLLEVLTAYDFNKKHQKVSMKPMQFLYMLRLSKSQLLENGFKDALIDTIYGQLLEYLSSNSHSIAFPDLSLFCIIQLKLFLKKCGVAAYCRKIRQILEKIEQNNKFITSERRNVSFNLSDSKQIDAWEAVVRNKGTPLQTYYESWKTMKNVKRNKEATNNEAIADYNLPTLKKHDKTRNAVKDPSEKVELFPSDSESDTAEEVIEKSKPKRGKRGGKNVNKKPAMVVSNDENPESDDDMEDVVEDLKSSDW